MMDSQELIDRLMDRIRIEMGSCRTILTVPIYQEFSIHELNFLIELLKIINTNESLSTAHYIKEIIKKAKNETFKLGD